MKRRAILALLELSAADTGWPLVIAHA